MRKFLISNVKFQKENFCYQKGQVVIVVMLVSALVMSLGMSISQKTVTETKVESDEALLKEAFSAAESGVDYYLATRETDFSGSGVRAEVEISTLGGGNEIDSGAYVMDREAALFWLTSRDSDGDLVYGSGDYFVGDEVKVCRDNVNLTNGTFKIDFFYKSGLSYRVRRWMYNFGVGTVSGVENGILISGECDGGKPGVVLSLDLGMGEVPVLLAVTPVGGGSRIYLDGGSENFPVQGEEISSLGKAGDLEGGTGVSRQVKVINRYDELPLFMLEAITAMGSVY